MMITELPHRLSEYHDKQLYRYRHARPAHQFLIDFSHNDYLNLSEHPAVIQACQATIEQYGVGCGASQLVSGHTMVHQDCETAFAEFLQRDRALLFANGYMANLGVIDALMNRGDRVYQDRHNHASLLDGARLSHAKLVRYSHNNTADLKERLAIQKSGQKLIASDGVFSMYGDIASADRLATLSKQCGATLMIDDAHGIGVLGERGRGTLEHFGLSQDDVPILVCPLGKSLGVYGAIVAGSHELIESLIQFARTYMYTTAIPSALAGAAIQSLDLLQKETWRREKLHSIIQFFRQSAKKRDIVLLNSETAIQAIVVGNAGVAIALSKRLQSAGFLVYPMRPPSVPEGQSFLRITLNTRHTEAHITQLLDTLQ